MKATLYKCKDSDNTLNKSLTDPKEINIILRGNTDINSPVIRLKNVGEGYNYLVLDGLNRSYFIRERTYTAGNVFAYHCELDVLETYREKALAATGVVKRSVVKGEFGNVDLTPTGRTTESLHYSNVELEKGDGAVISILKGETVQ